VKQREGYARIFDPAKPRAVEMGTLTCGHCNRVVHLHDQQGRAKSGVLVHCYQCDGKICVPCAEKARCTPFEKRLEAMEASAALRRVL
jgi:hypothetical protein